MFAMDKVSAQMAKRSGQYEEVRGQRRSGYGESIEYWSSKVVVALLVLMAFIWFRHEQKSDAKPAGSSVAHPIQMTQAQTLPHPPQPYTYSSFMTWLRSEDFSSVPGIGWRPDVEEFDIDAAAESKKFGPYLVGPYSSKAISVAKDINKYSLMEDVITSGDLTAVAGPAMHLYILTKLLPAASDSSKPSFLDAGCGIGYLNLAWVLVTGAGSQSVGIDISAKNVESAKKHLAAGDATDTREVQVPHDAKLVIEVGDALNPDANALGVDIGTLDAINVGMAIKDFADLSPLAKLLRKGGLLAAPMCLAQQPDNIPAGKCDAHFQILHRAEDGSLQRDSSDPDIPVRFIVAMHSVAAQGNLRGNR